MATIFVTGSTDGLGLLAAKALIQMGHQVALHARNEHRAKQVLEKLPKTSILVGDLSSVAETKELALKANEVGTFDAVIHNAGVYQVSGNAMSAEGLPVLFAVNTLAPYILTALMHKPKRLIYTSSGMHLQGNPALDNLPTGQRKASYVSYADTKLHDVILSMTVARKLADVYSNAADPGWVPTKMGGAGAPDNLEKGFQTQVWLAVSNDSEAKVSGYYFHHKRPAHFLSLAKETAVQEKFIAVCEELTGVPFRS